MALDENTKALLDNCSEDLHETDQLSPDAKMYLGTQLAAVRNAANGSKDKIQALCDLMVVSTVDRVYERMRAPKLMAEVAGAAVAACAAKCATYNKLVGNAGDKTSSPSQFTPPPGRAGAVWAWTAAVRPIVWPISMLGSVLAITGLLPRVLILLERWVN